MWFSYGMKTTILPQSTAQNTTDYPNIFRPIPVNGQACEYTGLKHARLYHLLIKGPAAKHVRVASLREPGKARGKTLYSVRDLLRYLDALAREQAEQRGLVDSNEAA